MHRKALGKGLDALFSTNDTYDGTKNDKPAGRRIILVPLNDIIPNRAQPREYFAEEAMEELKKSIVENGILEPPVVRRKGDYFELIAGERRYRAAKELGYEKIEVILMEVESDEKMLVLSLIENIQREDLNAIEEGKAYQLIMSKMNITQDELSSVVGKSRSSIANTIRLLNLSPEVQKMVSAGFLAPGSARPLVIVEDEKLQVSLAKKISAEGLSSRKAEELVKKALSEKKKPEPVKAVSPFVETIRLDIQRFLGTEVNIKGDNGKGKIEINFYSQDDLVRILETLKGNQQEDN